MIHNEPSYYGLTVNEAGTHSVRLSNFSNPGNPSELEFILLDDNNNPVVPNGGWPTGEPDYATLYDYDLVPGISYVLAIKNTCTPGCSTDEHILFTTKDGSYSSTPIQGLTATDAPLPVRWGKPVLIQDERSITATITTYAETDNDYLQLQYSQDGDTWLDGSVVDGHGTTSERHDYSLTLEKRERAIMPGEVYIRFKQVDLNKEYSYSPVSSIKVSGKELSIGPNPVQDQLWISSPYPVTDVTIWNMLGEQVYHGSETTINMSDQVAGTYLITVTYQSGHEVKKRFIKQ